MKKLTQIDIQNLYYALRLAVPRPADPSLAASDVLSAIRAEIAAVGTSQPSTGASSGLTAAQDGTLATAAADIATVKRLIEKDLAP